MKLLSAFLVTLFISSCNNSSLSKEIRIESSIAIQPFKGVDSSLTKAILVYLQNNSTNNIFVLPEMNLPASAYVQSRNRYSADSIIFILKKCTRGGEQKVVGLTTADIETSLEGKKHWGIMGLGYCPGPTAIISTYRLNKGHPSQVVLFNRTVNVCLHETGHNFSLPHCGNKSCIMTDANGGMPSNLIGQFCPNCLKTLHQKGWKYNQPPTTYSQHAENKEKKSG